MATSRLEGAKRRMVAFAVAIALAAFLSSTASAVVLLEESFSGYTLNTDIATLGGAGTGWDGGWYTPNASPDQARVQAGSLSYTDSSGNTLNTSGGHLDINTPSGPLSVFRKMDTQALGTNPATSSIMFDNDAQGTDYQIGKAGSSVWVSYLMKASPNAAFPGMGLFSGDEAGNGTPIRLQVGGPIDGDYNSDGAVDAADYAVWRNNFGAPNGTLPNDPNGSAIGADQYNTWRSNFGGTSAETQNRQLTFADDVTVDFNNGDIQGTVDAAVRPYGARGDFGLKGGQAVDPNTQLPFNAIAMSPHRNGTNLTVPGSGDTTEVPVDNIPPSSSANLIVMRFDFTGDPDLMDADGNWIRYPWFDPATGIADINGGDDAATAGVHPDADQIYIWVNPELDTTPSDADALAGINSSGHFHYFGEKYRFNNGAPHWYIDNFDFKFDRLRLWSNDGVAGDNVFDEVRFATTWGEVSPFTAPGAVAGSTAAPEPSVLMLLTSLGGLLAAGHRRSA